MNVPAGMVVGLDWPISVSSQSRTKMGANNGEMQKEISDSNSS